MKAWLCTWPNGDVTVIAAPSRDSAIIMLDQIDDPSDVKMEPIREGFMVGFMQAKNELGWEFENMNQELEGRLAQKAGTRAEVNQES